MISGGSIGRVTGRKRSGHLEAMLAVAGSSPRKERAYPGVSISFSDEDYPTDHIERHDGALVITAQVGPVDMKRMMIDNGSSVDILYTHAYQRMDLGGRKMDLGGKGPLYSFSGNPVHVSGTIELPVKFGTAPLEVEIMEKKFVVQVDSAYNAILGRPTLAALQVITSIPHFKIKFPTPNRIGEVKGDLDIARRCYRNTLISSGVGVSKQKQTMAIEIEPFTEGSTEPMALLAEETEDVELIPGNPEKLIKIGAGLTEPLRTGLVDLLRVYADIFAWEPSDMPGVSESVALHKLHTDPNRKPVIQKRRIFAPKR